MLIRFFGPFESLAEREAEIHLESPLTVGDLIEQLLSGTIRGWLDTPRSGPTPIFPRIWSF